MPAVHTGHAHVQQQARGLLCATGARKSGDAKVSAWNPKERMSLSVDRRTDASSSTIETSRSATVCFVVRTLDSSSAMFLTESRPRA
jgi:hypothetical protein